LNKIFSKITHYFFPEKPASAGDLWLFWISHANRMSWINIILMIVLLVESTVIFMTINKAPLVVRVDEVGNAQAVNIQLNNATADVEVNAVAKDFLRSYLEINSVTVKKDMAKALNMMSKRFQNAHIIQIRADNTLKYIIDANIQTQLEIKQLSITSRSDSKFILDVRGITSTTPLENLSSPPTKKGFLGRMTLLVVPRTESTPNGLIIDDFRRKMVPLEELMGADKIMINEVNK
jgi:hypothetical protein